MMDINLDKRYTDFVLGRINAFKHVHPTALTLLGLGMDFVVLYAVWAASIWLLAVSLFVRYSCDCLDGAVARKYGKVSDLGGALDTLADNTLIFVVTLCLGRLMGVPFYWLLAAGVTTANVWYLWKKGALVHHTSIKQGGTFLQNIYRLGVNNNAVIYLAAFVALVALL